MAMIVDLRLKLVDLDQCSFLLLLQKKRTKEKEAGKDNHTLFSPFAQSHFPLQKRGVVRAFSGLPTLDSDYSAC